MPAPRVSTGMGWALRLAIAVYLAASLAHFIHNAQFVADWPNLPPSLTRTVIYATWLGITALGAVGAALWWRGWRRTGGALLAVYAAIGFDGFLHYTRAPMLAHSAVMNFTVWFEGAAALLLLLAIAFTWRNGARTG